ncbi:MAG: periplasmic heavy metal sensor [Devosia sp.]
MNKIRLLLIASLAVNLFLAGWWVGNTLRQPPGFQMPIPQMMRYADRASPEEREAIREIFEKVDAVIRAGFERRTETFTKLREIVTHDPFDEAEFNRLIAELPAQRIASEEQQWAIIRDSIIALSAENRQALAEVFFMPPGPPPGGGPSPGNMPPQGPPRQ